MKLTVERSEIEGLGILATRPFRTGERIKRVNVVRDVTPEITKSS